jgi:hypothetical protein
MNESDIDGFDICLRRINHIRGITYRGEKRVGKVPDSGDIRLEFYKVTYETTKDDILAIINQVFIES